MPTSQLTLGLDLGPNSIGWAILDEANHRIVDTGVRVFPEGVDRDQQGAEHPKNAQRRIARGMRRQIARRARRKRALKEALIRCGLFPSDPDKQQELFDQDPYLLRDKALREPLEPHEIGRVLIHLNQRRGFKSNRKEDRKKSRETSELLSEINELAASMHAAGHATLGVHLASRRTADPHTRIRGQHTRRDMLEAEFDAIWDKQFNFHPDILTDTIRYGSDEAAQQYPQQPRARNHGDTLLEAYGVHGIIFFQRPMYWPKSVIGQCELEPKLKRCPRADRQAQRFRLLQEVNNLRMLDTDTGEERALEPHERALLIEYLSAGAERSFDQIRNHLSKKLDLPATIRFNLERGDRTKLLGMPTDAILSHKDLFGKPWHTKPEDERNRIVRSLLDDDEESILRKATAEWGLDAETADRLLDTDLEGRRAKGYASYSRVAIEKLMPHLERGLPMMSKDGQASAMSEAGYLRPDQRVVNERDDLPLPPDLTNPLVRQALYEVRKLVNAIIREYDKPDRIHIELAREVRGTAESRAKRSKEMRDRQAKRDKAADEIRKMGVKVTRDAIDRFLLWEEQHRECIYSGKPISQTQLFSGEIEVDHILPRERSLDNSMMNRVLCFRKENANKADRTPHEWLAAEAPAKYDTVLQRAAKLPYPKARRFRQKDIELDEFIARQLIDASYIASQVKQYVECLGADVLCCNGTHTSTLRRHWGLNTVLRNDAIDLKNREDHRHHAVDAVVVALTNRSRLQKLAKVYRDERTGRETRLPDPWSKFRDEVEDRINAIHVSHRPRRRVKGPLHEETIYGPTSTPNEFSYRKPLGALTVSMIDAIRDDTVRSIVRQRVDACKHLVKGQTIPKEVWKEPLLMKARAGKSAVQIKKVRLLKKDKTITPIRSGTACVKTGKIHHGCLFEFTDNKGRTRRDLVCVSLLEARQRIRNGEPVVQRHHPDNPDATFIMSLSPGDMLLADFHGEERLVLVSTLVSTQKRIHIVDATDARPSAKRKDQGKTPSSLTGRKVTVDPLGRIRWAND